MATILIVEDEEEMQELLQMALKRAGHEVVACLNGVEALYLATYHQPDLIVLDLMMPLASGDAVLGFIRSTDAIKDIPVLIVSAHPNGARLAHQLEADGFLPKPLAMQDLTAQVEALLQAAAKA
ncbi:MAG: response regulator [Chloroflexi bacterium]|nr:response regulator [Chloroflexota bacterium]